MTTQHRREHESKFAKLFSYFVLGFVLVFTQGLEYYGWFASANGKILNFFLSRNGRDSAPNSKLDRGVVTVEIDDKGYQQCFQGRSPMDPEQVWRLVSLVQNAGAAVIGVDIFTDADEYAGEYKNIAQRITRPESIVWASAAQHSWDYAPSFWGWLIGKEDAIIAEPTQVLGFEPLSIKSPPPVLWALPLFPREDDSTIRRLPLDITVTEDIRTPEGGDAKPLFARLIAKQYCAFLRTKGEPCSQQKGDEILIPYGGDAPRRLRLSDFLYCSAATKAGERPGSMDYLPDTRDLFQSLVKDKVALIGGTFGSVDLHDSPKGRIPGLFINAYAVKAQIEGSAYFAVDQPFAWMLDLLLGLLFLFVEHWTESREWTHKHRVFLFASFLVCWVVILVYLGLATTTWLKYIPGFVTIIIGMSVHEFIRLARAYIKSNRLNPKHTDRSSRPALHQE